MNKLNKVVVAFLLSNVSFFVTASNQNTSEVVAVPYTESDTSMKSSAQNTKLDVNAATAEQLVSIKGIGPSKAAAIIKYRNEIGGFTSIEELVEVKGIGQKALANLKLFLKV